MSTENYGAMLEWVNARIPTEQREAIKRLVENKKYPSISEFLRTAVRNQLEYDMKFERALKKESENSGRKKRGAKKSQGD